MERAADAAGFTLFTEDKPSRGYRNLLEMYKTMHEEGWTQAQWSAQETFDGKSLKRHIQPVAALIRETGAASLLDYGRSYARRVGKECVRPFRSRGSPDTLQQKNQLKRTSTNLYKHTK